MTENTRLQKTEVKSYWLQPYIGIFGYSLCSVQCRLMQKSYRMFCVGTNLELEKFQTSYTQAVYILCAPMFYIQQTGLQLSNEYNPQETGIHYEHFVIKDYFRLIC